MPKKFRFHGVIGYTAIFQENKSSGFDPIIFLQFLPIEYEHPLLTFLGGIGKPSAIRTKDQAMDFFICWSFLTILNH